MLWTGPPATGIAMSAFGGDLNGSTQHFILNEEMECMQMTRRNGRGLAENTHARLFGGRISGCAGAPSDPETGNSACLHGKIRKGEGRPTLSSIRRAWGVLPSPALVAGRRLRLLPRHLLRRRLDPLAVLRFHLRCPIRGSRSRGGGSCSSIPIMFLPLISLMS